MGTSGWMGFPGVMVLTPKGANWPTEAGPLMYQAGHDFKEWMYEDKEVQFELRIDDDEFWGKALTHKSNKAVFKEIFGEGLDEAFEAASSKEHCLTPNGAKLGASTLCISRRTGMAQVETG